MWVRKATSETKHSLTECEAEPYKKNEYDKTEEKQTKDKKTAITLDMCFM